MERLSQLIGKLKEQFEQSADPSQLLVITRHIQAELELLSATSRKSFSTSKVAVVMPSSRPVQAAVATAAAVKEAPKPVPEAKEEVVKNGTPKPQVAELNFDPLREIPTLAQQQTARELNESMASQDFSLNDKLKEEVIEVGHRLTDAPVRDLRKAIGINDRFVFVNELFRGDDVMYERSIKTINGFRIFAEAEYWIERELKVKLGWDESRSSTRHFYQLVKRRFS
ncbi:MAG: hypothetical protein QM731_13450 [Chitinophagaceae bacterium]